MGMTMKIARLIAKKTQQQVADEMGIHVQTYAKLENNSENVTIGEAKQFSQIVGVPFSDIFFGNDSN